MTKPLIYGQGGKHSLGCRTLAYAASVIIDYNGI
jgi:hypothetical protein